MDAPQLWTVFMISAEIDGWGVHRLVKTHNSIVKKLIDEIQQLKSRLDAVRADEREACCTTLDQKVNAIGRGLVYREDAKRAIRDRGAR